MRNQRAEEKDPRLRGFMLTSRVAEFITRRTCISDLSTEARQNLAQPATPPTTLEHTLACLILEVFLQLKQDHFEPHHLCRFEGFVI